MFPAAVNKSAPTGQAGASGKAVNPCDIAALGPTPPSPHPSEPMLGCSSQGDGSCPTLAGDTWISITFPCFASVRCCHSGRILEWRGSSSGRLFFIVPAVHSCSMADWKVIYSPHVNNLEGSESQLCKAPTVSARCVSGSRCKGDWHLEELFGGGLGTGRWLQQLRRIYCWWEGCRGYLAHNYWYLKALFAPPFQSNIESIYPL